MGPSSSYEAFPGLLSALLATTTDDELVAVLVGVPGATLGLAPRADRVTSTGGLALTATMRVVNRVHGDTTHRRAFALPAHATGFAPVDVALLGIAHFADRRAAAQVDVADLAGRHTQLRVGTVLGHELHLGAGRPRDLGAAAGAELDRVEDRTHWDVAHRQAVARLDVGSRAALDLVALAELVRRQGVALGQTEIGATGLALAFESVDRVDLHAKDAFDCNLDLGLVGTRIDDEGVLALVQQTVGLLGHHRGQQNVAGVLVQRVHLVSSLSCAAFAALTGVAALTGFAAFAALTGVAALTGFAAFAALAGFAALGASTSTMSSASLTSAFPDLPLVGPARKVLSCLL